MHKLIKPRNIRVLDITIDEIRTILEIILIITIKTFQLQQSMMLVRIGKNKTWLIGIWKSRRLY